MGLEGILGRLQALLDLQPYKTELILDVVDHDHLGLAVVIVGSILSGGVGTSKLEVLADLLGVLAAVSLPQDGAVLRLSDVVGVRENLVAGDDVLKIVSLQIINIQVEDSMPTPGGPKRSGSETTWGNIQCK